jgi:hypothetical protein
MMRFQSRHCERSEAARSSLPLVGRDGVGVVTSVSAGTLAKTFPVHPSAFADCVPTPTPTHKGEGKECAAA